MPPVTNEEVAHALEQAAALLEYQHANPFRVRAYRRAAEAVRALETPVAAHLLAHGTQGLTRLPGIGDGLAQAIHQFVRTRRLGILEGLRGAPHCERLLRSVTGIGPKLARRLHEELGIETLKDLEDACRDGRLRSLPGFGDRRVQGVLETLTGRLHCPPGGATASRVPAPPPEIDAPSVAELLDVDFEYRKKAHQDQLPRIAPRRFNPTGDRWLPILHTERGQRHYTALYSNTARAHELGMTRDWVVIYRDDDGHQGQWTVVTSLHGPLEGQRIVRGRDAECAFFYDARRPAPATPGTSPPARNPSAA